ncbi:cell division protein FtsQ/DivIB [Sediminitomix flava]|uniref:Cell division protein FtsQ n=1 Tax=Sediminitomix flava TaxID=379075 RepID=A0A315Z9J5_SEDFL|nr:hypothetical protein [Sediminitomix flava]PWJ42080.1 cell division protein FtsQ [Sediminitomix flava]
MSLQLLKLKWGILVAVFLLILSAFYVFNKGYQVSDEKYTIQISDRHVSKFVNDSEIKDIITQFNAENLDIEDNEYLLRLEQKLRKLDFIQSVQVARDPNGRLLVNIEQDGPLARVLTPEGKGAYVTQDGKVIQLSQKFTSRVVMLTGKGANKLLKPNFYNTLEGYKILRFLRYIFHDEFFKSNISQLSFGADNQILIYTQIGNQTFEFGTVEDFESKLDKMKIYYNDIVKSEGWNTYKLVKLQYSNQIVCK